MNNNNNKTYRIFLASSEKLEEERTAIEKAISRLNDHFNKRGTYLNLVIWEKLDASIAEIRKQDDYNRELGTCDILLLVYWEELGRFTYEEYKIAHQLFRESQGTKPRIYILKKDVTTTRELLPENIEKLRTLEEALQQEDKEQWATPFSNKDALILKVNDLIEGLFRNKHLKHGNEVLFNEASEENLGFVIRKNKLLEARNKLTDKRKILYINGISGSGKTKFAENLLYDVSYPDNVVWIDCAESNPTPREIAIKLQKIIKFDLISAQRKAEIQRRLDAPDQADIGKLNDEVLNDLSNQLPSATLDDIRDWFPKEVYENRSFYLVLDDYDNLISEDGLRAHWLASNFVEKCLEYDYSPCIIIIFKYADKEKEDKTGNYLEKTNNVLDTLAPLRHNEIKLRYLSDGETDEFYARRAENIIHKRRLAEVSKLKDSWMPVQLQLLTQLFTDKFRYEMTEPYFKRIKEVVTKNAHHDTHLITQLCEFLFERIADDPMGKKLIIIAFASSILQKYNAGHRAIDKSALKFMLIDDYDEERIESGLSTLCLYNVLKKFHDHPSISNDYHEYSFQHDTKLNYCFNELVGSGLNASLHSDKKEFFHSRAADFYKKAFENEKDESLKVKYGEFAVWNYSQLLKPREVKARLLTALPILDKIDRELRTSFNYQVLNELRIAVVPELKAVFQQKTPITYFIDFLNDDYTEEQASNLADLAEIYFQGLDQWGQAKNIVLDVYKRLKERVSTGESPTARNAFLQAAHLVTILSFETSINEKDFYSNFNCDGEYDDILKKQKYKLCCIRFAEIALRKYLNIEVLEIYKGRKYASHEIIKLNNKAIIANLACSLGVFLNRSEKYSEAITVYEFASQIIESLVKDIDITVDVKINACVENSDKAVSYEEKVYWKEKQNYWLNRGEDLKEFIDKDLMGIHSNLSRTILLMKGVKEAIQYFNQHLSSWFGDRPKWTNPNHSYSSGQEYNYAIINICYYHFCKGDIKEAVKWLDKSQDIPGEDWLKATNEQMRLVLRSYDIGIFDKEEVMRRFKDNCEQFKAIEDTRGVLFSEFNREALNIALHLKEFAIYGSRAWTGELNEVFSNLLTFREIADEKEYFLASKVITYTHNQFLNLLQENWKVEKERQVLKPSPKWKKEWLKEEVLNHLEGIMTCDSPELSFSAWRPPMLMAGILLMRSKPFSPSDYELQQFKAGEA